MNETHKELAKQFEQLLGPDHVVAESDIMIDGSASPLIVRPDSTERVAACLRVCAELKAAVVPAGLMTWLESGNPLRRADVVLSLERVNRIIDYSPPDLTVTVEAGLALDALNTRARSEGQWLPLDPPGSSRASIGAIAACASSGALRTGFGAPRDYVIGLRLAHADGTESKSGGRVVKNVAGYDMNKLYVGSLGTLAVLTELTFKLRPLPERFATLIVTSESRSSLFECAKRLLASYLQPVSVVIAEKTPNDALASYESDRALFIRFAESESAVLHQLEQATQMLDQESHATLLDEGETDRVWSQIADLDLQAEHAVRLSVPLSATTNVFDKAMEARPECVAACDLGAGIIRLAFDEDIEPAIELIKRLRAEVERMGGTLFIERAPTRVRQQADAWGDVGPTAGLMKAIKAKFDPHSLLNPGRFVSGI